MRIAAPRGLRARLLTAQILVLVTAVAAAWVLAGVVGPPIFRDHLAQVGHMGSEAEAADHAERAFREASVIATGLSLLVALVVAVAVSAWVTRRIAGPVEHFSAAAADVAAGRYDVRLPRLGLGREFDQFAGSFTDMADRLGATEQTRRRLLADLAHELRTPVATLGAYLEAIDDGVQVLDDETKTMLRGQTARLARLADDIASVSRAEEHQMSLHREVVTAHQLVDGAVAAGAERYAAAGVELRTVVAAGARPVSVDPDRLGQVLGNLLDNALRHTATGGTVVVEVTPSAGGRGVVVEVRDDGVGIPAEHLPHVFERFYRVDAARDRDHGGSGIGLAIAKALVEAHGGTITARSDGVGTGAIFSITLPAQPSVSTPRPSTAGSSTAGPFTPRGTS